MRHYIHLILFKSLFFFLRNKSLFMVEIFSPLLQNGQLVMVWTGFTLQLLCQQIQLIQIH